MTRIKLLVLFGGVALFILGWREWQLKLVARDTPQTISASQLAANGPGDNAHIVLTNYELCDDLVYEEDSRSKKWKKVWVPAAPHGQACGGSVQIIVVDTNCRSEMDVAALQRGSLEGVVTNKISSLGREERKLLSESYPGTDFSRCWIVEHGRKMWSPSGVVAMMGLGGFVFLGGLASVAAGLQDR